jgi:4-hydroxybenzoate polyprenyltransferase
MKKNFTDIRFDIMARLPESMRPYAIMARLDRPTGIYLLLLPCLWGIFFSLHGILQIGLEPLRIIFLMLIGSIVMRGAGCVINDLWDRHLDQKVERTAQRPLASGQISVKQAFAFLAGLLFIGLLILMQLPGLSIIIGLFSMSLVIAYPLMKRFTFWPQAFLGITFNIGILIAWAAVTGIIEPPALWLYVSGFFWTMAYDTIYAYQDIEDDRMIDIKSTARLFDKNGPFWIMGFYAVMFIGLIMAGISAKAGFLYYILLLAPAYYTYKISWYFDPASQDSALTHFKKNAVLGALILLAILFV